MKIDYVDPPLAVSSLSFVNAKSLISGLLIFLLCLSGRFTTERLGFGDYEVRHVFVVLTGIWALFIMASTGAAKSSINVVLMVLVFCLICSIAALYNQAGILVVNKLFDVWLLFLLVVCSWVLFSKDPAAARWFLLFMACAGGGYSVLVILSVGGGSRGGTGVSGSNVTTRIIFMGMVSVIYLIEIYRNKILYLSIPLFIAAIIGVGSRGGMVSASLVLALYFGYSVVSGVLQGKSLLHAAFSLLKKSFAIFIVGVGFLIAFFPLVKSVFERRVMGLLIDRVHFAGRDDLYMVSLEAIQENLLFGLGLGGYEAIGISNYPHNIILELMLDGGLMLAWMMLAFAYMSIKVVIRGHGSIIAFVCGYMLCVQMFSGDYYDFRYFFVYLIVASVLCYDGKINGRKLGAA